MLSRGKQSCKASFGFKRSSPALTSNSTRWKLAPPNANNKFSPRFSNKHPITEDSFQQTGQRAVTELAWDSPTPTLPPLFPVLISQGMFSLPRNQGLCMMLEAITRYRWKTQRDFLFPGKLASALLMLHYLELMFACSVFKKQAKSAWHCRLQTSIPRRGQKEWPRE